jgi:NAD(P)-dependent dehydrogenase (short-subunit alcohol dehydrogenase family)
MMMVLPRCSLTSKSFLVVASLLLLMISMASTLANTAPLKRVLITGANKGIGKAIAKKLVETYDDVSVIIGSRDVGRGEQAVNDIKKEVPGCKIEMVELDVTNDASVEAAFQKVCGRDGSKKLYGIVNNAGIGFGNGFEKTLATNYWGVRRVCDVFTKAVDKRIVNIASASGPNFLSRCQDAELKNLLANPLTTSIEKLDEIAESYKSQTDYEDTAYGLSKALLNAYTALHAKENPNLIINSCSPGYILTDLTAGMGATNPPEKGTVSPVHLLMAEEMEEKPTGRYYGSDAKRSPLHYYRGPGEPEYEPENELVEFN